MKKYVALSVIVMCIGGMILMHMCSDEKRWEKFSFTSDSLMYEMNEKQLEEYGIKPSWLTFYKAYASLSKLEKERVFILKSDYQKEIKEVLLTKVDDTALWYIDEDYVIVVQSVNAHTIMEEIKECL